MSDEIYPKTDLHRLCSDTRVTEELIALLLANFIISEDDAQTIMTANSDFGKAFSLYRILRFRPSNEKQKIIQLFRQSANEKAALIIEGKLTANPQISSRNLSNLTENSNLVKNVETKQNPTIYTVAAHLNTTGDLLSCSPEIMHIFRIIIARSDPSENDMWWQSFKRGEIKPVEFIENVLAFWVRSRGDKATIGELIEILKTNGQFYAADMLRKDFNVDDRLRW